MENRTTGYRFNLKTGEFVNEEAVYLDERTGEYPHASNITLVAPPDVAEGQKAVFDGECWKAVDDYRGFPIYADDGSVSGFTEVLGEVPKIKKKPPKKEAHVKRSWDSEKEEWVQTADEGYVREAGGTVRKMTQVERIRAGIEELPKGCKIVDDRIVPKTLQERYDDGEVTAEEYNEIQEQNRQAEYNDTLNGSNRIAFQYMLDGSPETRARWLERVEAIKAKYPKWRILSDRR